MSSRPVSRPRPLGQLLAVAALTGALAAAAVGAIDALWSWRAAAQFAPGIATRLRFIVYVACAHAVAGALAGVLVGAVVAALRPTRLGDLYRFALADHAARRARDPRLAVAGVA